MSTPTTHDPLVVNTTDGVVWQRRAVTAEGRGLYAVTGSCNCPEFLMATLAELAEHGIAGSAFALPMPVGRKPQAETLPLTVVAELNDLRARLAGMTNPPREVFLAEYEGAEPGLFTTVEAARAYCDDFAPIDAQDRGWDWTVNEHGVHIQFWTHVDDDRPLSQTSGSVTPTVVQGEDDLPEPLSLTEQQIDALAEAGNRAVNDAVHEDLCACDAWPEKCLSSGGYFQGFWDMGGLETALPAVLGLWEQMRGGELVALRARVAELEQGPTLPWAHAMPDDDLHGFLDHLVSAALNRWQTDRDGTDVPDRVTLAEIEKACAQWRTPGQGYRSDEDEPAKPGVCCHLHKQACCDPEDCGPCCEQCPTCPTLARQRAAESGGV